MHVKLEAVAYSEGINFLLPFEQRLNAKGNCKPPNVYLGCCGPQEHTMVLSRVEIIASMLTGLSEREIRLRGVEVERWSQGHKVPWWTSKDVQKHSILNRESP